MQYLLGLDIGSSSVKASLVAVDSGETVASVQSPSEEMAMLAPHPGWAEQDPDMWWTHAVICIKLCLMKSGIDAATIKGIGISYQMHGLVMVGKDHKPLRPSIIWCDSRAVSIGDKAMKDLGNQYCLEHLLNSPGNFTASKLKWVKENEPRIFEQVYKVMLPGDYIALRLSGDVVTTDTGLSEGMFWDHAEGKVASKLLEYYGLNQSTLAQQVPVFSVQGKVSAKAASETGLALGTAISYRAGDQPNNAFSLNVLHAGETAATAGTSGVIYSVTDKNAIDAQSRVNTFLHVNNTSSGKRNGVLLCVNGTGIMNSWLRKSMKVNETAYSYDQMNNLATEVPIGSEGVMVMPFGNGAERIFENKDLGASFHGMNFNTHTQAHLLRAAQEGIVFALRYGFDILQEMGLKTTVIRAGNANMFLSPLFREAFVNTIGAPVELYNTDGAKGAALGAGVGAGVYKSFEEAFRGLKVIRSESPSTGKAEQYQEAYGKWKSALSKKLTT